MYLFMRILLVALLALSARAESMMTFEVSPMAPVSQLSVELPQWSLPEFKNRGQQLLHRVRHAMRFESSSVRQQLPSAKVAMANRIVPIGVCMSLLFSLAIVLFGLRETLRER